MLTPEKKERRSGVEPPKGTKIHELKCHPEPFSLTMKGLKLYELRKNDRDFKVGDGLRLREWDPKTETYSGREYLVPIVCMTMGGQFGLPLDLCILGLGVFWQRTT